MLARDGKCPLIALRRAQPQDGPNQKVHGGQQMLEVLRNMWRDDEGQDIAEYAVMLAVILVIVVGTIRLIGSQANNVFSETASALAG